MSLRVEFLSGADADLQEIFNRFEDYRQGFGAEFITVVDATSRALLFFRRSHQFTLKTFDDR